MELHHGPESLLPGASGRDPGLCRLRGPDGVPYSLIAYNDRLYAVEPNHGQVTETTTDGSTKQVIDLSFSQAHIVPTSILARDNNLYLGNLGQFPIQQTFERVITLSQNLGFIETMPGLETKPADLNKFRVANSRAGFTTIVSLKLGPDGLLYVLDLSDAGRVSRAGKWQGDQGQNRWHVAGGGYGVERSHRHDLRTR